MLLLTLKAGTNRYAIDVVRVIELVPRVELTTIPHAPLPLAGLLQYRGKVIPVIDLGLFFCRVPCRDCLSTRIVLVDDGEGDHSSGMDATGHSSKWQSHSPIDPTRGARLLGLIGEQVSDLTHVEPEQVARAPVQLAQTAFIDAIVQTEGGIIQLIAVERIRELALGAYVLDQGAAQNASPSNAAAGMLAREVSTTGA